MITGGMLGVVSDKKEGTRGTDRAHAGHNYKLHKLSPIAHNH